MTDGELLFLWIGFITGLTTPFILTLIYDYSTYRDLQKRMKKEKEAEG